MKTLVILLTVLESLLQVLSGNTLVSDINMQVSSSASQPITYAGTMAMKGERFKIEIMGMAGAYDGTTLAIYQQEADELTLSNPTREELTQVNPLLLLQAALPMCNTTEKASKKGDETIITFTPKDTQPATTAQAALANDIKDIKKMVLRVNNSDMLIRSIEITETNSVSLLSFIGARYTEDIFSFTLKPDDYPTAYVNDIR